MKVQDIMTREVVSCKKETDIGTAARLMREGRFGTLPVLDTHGRLAGIITDRDIAIAAGTRQRNAAHIAVVEGMSQPVQYCLAEDTVAAALKKIEEAGVHRLPVLDASGHLEGIVSVDDIAARAVNRPGGVTPSAFVHAITRINLRPIAGPPLNGSDTFASG